jgi:acetylglutamate kinase
VTDTKHLRVVGGAGEQNDVLPLRIDVVTAATRLAEAIDAKGLTDVEWHVEVEKATDEVYRRAKAYMKACRERQG